MNAAQIALCSVKENANNGGRDRLWNRPSAMYLQGSSLFRNAPLEIYSGTLAPFLSLNTR